MYFLVSLSGSTFLLDQPTAEALGTGAPRHSERPIPGHMRPFLDEVFYCGCNPLLNTSVLRESAAEGILFSVSPDTIASFGVSLAGWANHPVVLELPDPANSCRPWELSQAELTLRDGLSTFRQIALEVKKELDSRIPSLPVPPVACSVARTGSPALVPTEMEGAHTLSSSPQQGQKRRTRSPLPVPAPKRPRLLNPDPAGSLSGPTSPVAMARLKRRAISATDQEAAVPRPAAKRRRINMKGVGRAALRGLLGCLPPREAPGRHGLVGARGLYC